MQQLRSSATTEEQRYLSWRRMPVDDDELYAKLEDENPEYPLYGVNACIIGLLAPSLAFVGDLLRVDMPLLRHPAAWASGPNDFWLFRPLAAAVDSVQNLNWCIV